MSESPLPKETKWIRRARELRTIAAMIRMYCRAHHTTAEAPCDACRVLQGYAERRLARCPFGEEKPTCNKCRVHCYSAERREQVREVMRWAGPRMLKFHPILGIRHLLDGRRPTPELPTKKKRTEASS